MPSTIGAGFSLQSVTHYADATIRVRFTHDPLAANPAGANDALNKSNWTVSGPGIMYVTSCGVVSGDPQSIDLFLVAPLTSGTWTVTASTAIQTPSATALGTPTSFQLTASVFSTQKPVSGGAKNLTEESTLRRHLNSALKGKAWEAIIAAIATGDKTNNTNAQLAYDQGFTSTASGIYLDRRVNDEGGERPRNIGISDELFRQYAIKTRAGKLTQKSLLDILEVLYGSDTVRGNATTALMAPFVLTSGDDLKLLIDNTDSVTITFQDADFGQIGAAKAIEVASVITRILRAVKSNAYAVAISDVETGLDKVRIYSGSQGLSSSVKITGGKAQNVLQFPTKLSVYTSGTLPTWTVTKDTTTNTIRFTTTTNPTRLDLTKVEIGDYVNVYGNPFNTSNRGSFAITNVFVGYPGGTFTQYFEIVNSSGVAETPIVQVAENDVLFFRPTLCTIQSTTDRTVVVSQHGGEIDVVLPATTQVVERERKTAAYLHVATAKTITDITRRPSGTAVVTASSHGFAVGDQVIIAGSYPNFTAPSTTAGGAATTSYSLASVTSTLATAAPVGVYHHKVLKLKNGLVVSMGGRQVSGGVGTTLANTFYLTATPSTPASEQTQYTYSWTASGAIPTTTRLFGASYRDDGSATGVIMLTGGINNAGTYLNTAYEYIDATSWSARGTLTTARAAHSQITLNDGNYLVIGGASAATTAISSCELYNVTTSSWGATGSMANTRCDHVAVKLQNGKILVIGGRDLTGGTIFYTGSGDVGVIRQQCELYDPAGGTWSTTGSMTYARIGHQAIVLADGRVLVIGGYGYNPTQSTTAATLKYCEIYDPNTGFWTDVPPLRSARSYFTAQYVSAHNRVYVIGNSSDLINEYLDLTTMTWHKSLAGNVRRKYAESAVFSDNSGIVIIGGENMDSGTGDTSTTNFILTPNSEIIASSGLNGVYRIASVPDANTFTYTTAEKFYTRSVVSGMSATPFKAPTKVSEGPFVFDTNDGLAITSTEATLGQDISNGFQYSKITLSTVGGTDPNPANRFPDAEGWLVFDFGYKNQTAPVKYLGRLSNLELAIDFSFVFPNDITSGAKVCLLSQRAAYEPTNPEEIGSFYATGSSAGRVAASSAIDDAAAAGFEVNKEIVYPGDKGLGGEGLPASGADKLSDKVAIWAGDDVEDEVDTAREDS